MRKIAIRTYERESSVVFLKTKDLFGGLSNMAAGYPIVINDTVVLTSEALYQSCRFPHLPDVQRLIISKNSPMTAKMVIKPYLDQSRVDWLRMRVRIMKWCLTCKIVQNWDRFSTLLLETQDLPIVEQSRKDKFWGAVPENDSTLVGANVLGRLLMELREIARAGEIIDSAPPPEVDNFLFLGQEISTVSRMGKLGSLGRDSLF
ncbi:NADAR family protein [Pseudomonas sp. 52 E 6]|uniref:NADAR family protein n=1 Tax=Pseudomonas sp. 52 E 6 TaxID=1844106 RepID=UPI0008125E57|nr:NADAR family protein [Pseudomonas sp. 52 E 6]CRM73076.1 Swarming motility protein YbiA [Pseudomonas sp. 52 E 6]